MSELYLPREQDNSLRSMWEWYENIRVELSGNSLMDDEKKYMADYYIEAGLLQWWRAPFFKRHFVESFLNASRYLLSSPADGCILDLGCGTGTQSIYLAIKGAKVVGVDMDGEALEIFRKRKAAYESSLGQTLDIEIHEGNVFDLDFTKFGDICGVYSMFAFNMMQPSSRLLKQIAAGMVSGSRIVVLDGNCQSLFARIWPSRRRAVWSPTEFSRELESSSIRVAEQSGGIVIPPQMWRLLPYQALATLDRALCGNMLLSVSHQTMGEH